MSTARYNLNFRHYCQSCKAAVLAEFAALIPLLVFFFIFMIDGGNLFAQYRNAQQLAESIARTARALDVAVADASTLPLSADSTAILRNIASRMRAQSPQGINYIWLGRFVVSQNGNKVPQQMLPAGLTSDDNRGIMLAGKDAHAEEANQDAINTIRNVLVPGDFIYVVNVTFSRGFIVPLPQKRLVFTVRYTL